MAEIYDNVKKNEFQKADKEKNMAEYIEKLENFTKRNLSQYSINYFNWSVYELENEKKNLLKKANDTRDTIFKYNSVKSYYANSNEKSILDDESLVEPNLNIMMLKDIEWLTEWVKSYTYKYWNTKNATEEDRCKYNDILERMSCVVDIFKTINEDEVEIPEILKCPNRILDMFFFDNLYDVLTIEQIVKSQKYALNVLSDIETITYTITNQLDEFDFDIQNYNDDFFVEVELTIELLDLLIFKTLKI